MLAFDEEGGSFLIRFGRKSLRSRSGRVFLLVPFSSNQVRLFISSLNKMVCLSTPPFSSNSTIEILFDGRDPILEKQMFLNRVHQ